MPETIMSSTSFSALSASFRRFVSSSRSSDDEMSLLAKDSKNYSSTAVSPVSSRCGGMQRTTWSLSCQNSFSLALSRKGKFRTWLTNMKRSRGSSESSGATSPASEWKGAPKRLRAVGDESSEISYFVWREMSPRLRSARGG